MDTSQRTIDSVAIAGVAYHPLTCERGKPNEQRYETKLVSRQAGEPRGTIMVRVKVRVSGFCPGLLSVGLLSGGICSGVFSHRICTPLKRINK